MQSCNIAHEIIEAIACNLSCRLKVNAVYLFHDISVIGDLKVGNSRLAEDLQLHVLAVVLTHRNRRVNDIGNSHHNGLDLFGKLSLLLFKLSKAVAELSYLSLCSLSLFLLALTHKCTYLLGDPVAVGTQAVCLLLGST